LRRFGWQGRRAGAADARHRTRPSRRLIRCAALVASEDPRHEPASSRGTPCGLPLEFLDTLLCRLQSLFEHDDRLRHVIGGTRLAGDPLANEGIGLRIAQRALPLDITETGKEPLDCVTILSIHGHGSSFWLKWR